MNDDHFCKEHYQNDPVMETECVWFEVLTVTSTMNTGFW